MRPFRVPFSTSQPLVKPPAVGDAGTATPEGAAGGPAAGALLDCGVYADGVRLPGTFTHADAMAKVSQIQAAGRGAFAWIRLHEPNADEMQHFAGTFDLHELAVEATLRAHQRPKLEHYDKTLFLVLKTLNYVPHESAVLPRQIVQTGEIMILVGKNFVISVRHGEHGELTEVRQRVEADPERLRLGPYTVLHAIAAYVVDRYVEVTRLMETDIDAIEELTFAPGVRTDVEPIYQIKREVVELRRAVAPLSVPFARMQSEHRDLIPEEIRRLLRDVADHQSRAADQIAGYDEMLSSLVQAALARVGMQQNIDVRKMSAWAGIFAAPSTIAGIYGMDFEHFLAPHWTFPVVIAMMASVCVVLYRAFHRNGWL